MIELDDEVVDIVAALGPVSALEVKNMLLGAGKEERLVELAIQRALNIGLIEIGPGLHLRLRLTANISSLSEWQPINSAPEDGTTVRLRGRWPGESEAVEIDGFYDSAGFTHGWVDAERMSTFYAEQWKPTPTTPNARDEG